MKRIFFFSGELPIRRFSLLGNEIFRNACKKLLCVPLNLLRSFSREPSFRGS